MRSRPRASSRARSGALVLSLVLALGGGLTACGGGSSSDDDASAKQLLELQQAREEGRKQVQDEARQKDLADTAASLKAEVARLKKGGTRTPRKASSGRTTTTVVQRPASGGGNGGGGGATGCGGGITVNSATSCTFARAVQSAYYRSGQSGSISAYSSVTGRSYAMTCRTSGSTVCTGGNNAEVTFP